MSIPLSEETPTGGTTHAVASLALVSSWNPQESPREVNKADLGGPGKENQGGGDTSMVDPNPESVPSTSHLPSIVPETLNPAPETLNPIPKKT